MDKIELLGGACFSHGPYTFYKAVRIGNGRVLRLGSFFLTKLWADADLVSIGELQLLWLDSRGSNQPLASLRLYFLPENTPDGRRNTHGEDEVLTIAEKVVVRVHDLVTWLSPSVEWSWGREVSLPTSPKSSSSEGSPQKLEGNYPQVLTDPGIDFTDVDKQQKEFETNLSGSTSQNEDNTYKTQPRVVVLSYPRYCRYRALLRRLEGAEPSWFSSSVAAALGGFTALPGTKVLFCRDTFDYPDLETHELLCNHLAPKLKGRPRRKRKKRSASPGESSNESEASVASTSRGAISNLSLAPALRPPSGVRRSERNTCGEEKRFLTDVHSFMRSRGTPVGKMPLLGYRQIDLFLFYAKVQKLGGYDSVSGGRLWKSIYDDIGGNVGSTSAATITRRHYERLLLPYERHQRGEETKVRLAHGRRLKCRSLSGDSIEAKPEIGRISTSETSLPPEAPTVASPVPPLLSILSSTPFLPGDKPKTEGGKTSSLRSVRVKPERLKSLNTIIANSTPVVNQNSSQLPSPSPPPSSNASSSSTSSSNTPSSTPSTTPTCAASVGPVAVGQSVLERQLNSPLVSQQVTPPSTSPPPAPPPPPPSLPVIAVTTHSAAIVTLTPPPEKDMKEMKLDPKPTSLLAQGKENIPIFGEKPIFAEKSLPPPKSPEVIDLEMENDTSRDKIVIPSFKKRKLEILREGGLEVTAVDLDARPSVIQATIVPVTTVSGHVTKNDETNGQSFSAPTTPNSVPKLISVTVTPDIGHMLPSHQEQSIVNGNSHVHPQTRPTAVKSSSHRSNLQTPTHQVNKSSSSTTTTTSTTTTANSTNNNTNNNNNNNNNNTNNNSTVANNNGSSRVINVGSPSNASLLQLYASATNAAQPNESSSPPVNHRFVPPSPTNDRQAPAPPKVTQSRSIFAHNEKVVYGNPKDILIPHNYHRPIVSQHQQSPHTASNTNTTTNTSAILDLTQKQQVDRSFARPNLEIVRVPVVPRTNPLNLDMKNSIAKEKLQEASSRKAAAFPGYAGMLDSRTMASNNLEITLVSPKHRGHPSTPPQVHQRPTSPSIARLQNNSTNNVSNSSCNNPINTVTSQQRRHQNGKYPSRLESAPQYASRKPSHQPIIPNIPNLHNLNNTAYTSLKTSAIHRQQQAQQHQQQQQQPPQQQPQAQQRQQKQEQEQPDKQQMLADNRKTTGESVSHDQLNNHQHRMNESDKTSIAGQQQQQQQQLHKANPASPRQHSDSSRRHNAPNPGLPTGYVGTPPQNSPGFLAQLPNTATKFLPMLDPLYYSAFYNGLFPSPVPPTSQPYIPPEFSAYYKELLASSQPRLAMAGQHQPAVPTSK